MRDFFMKRMIIFLFIAFCGFAYAQDIITKKDGNEIEAKILEVTPSEIKYKKFNNQEGPIYTLKISEIFMIKYQNGDKDVFSKNNISEGIVEGMLYREYKNNYNVNEYHPLPTDPYSRGWAGVASLLIPGLGEGIDGEWGRGALIFGANLALWATGFLLLYDYEGYSGPAYWSVFVVRLGINIWSIYDAVHIAKVKNMYNQDIRGKLTTLNVSIEPSLFYVPKYSFGSINPIAGLSLKLSF